MTSFSVFTLARRSYLSILIIAFLYSQQRHEEMKMMASRPFAKVCLALTDPGQPDTSKVGLIKKMHVLFVHCCKEYHPSKSHLDCAFRISAIYRIFSFLCFRE